MSGTEIKQTKPFDFKIEFINRQLHQNDSLKEIDVVVFISIKGNAFYEASNFYSLPTYLCRIFKNVLFVVGDSNHKANVKAKKIINSARVNDKECEIEAIKYGEAWLKKNKKAFLPVIKEQGNEGPSKDEIKTPEKFLSYVKALKTQQKINFEIITFNEWKARVQNTEYFKNTYQDYETSFQNQDTHIYKTWVEAGTSYATTNVPKYKNSLLSPEQISNVVQTQSQEYLKDEAYYVVVGSALLATLNGQPNKNVRTVSLYAGAGIRSPFFVAIQERFVGQQFPEYLGWGQIGWNETRETQETMKQDTAVPVLHPSLAIPNKNNNDDDNVLFKTSEQPRTKEPDILFTRFQENVLSSNVMALYLIQQQQLQQQIQLQMQLQQMQLQSAQQPVSKEEKSPWTNEDKHWAKQVIPTGYTLSFTRKTSKFPEQDGGVTEQIDYSFQIVPSFSTSPPKA